MAILAISTIGAIIAHSILKPYQIMRLLVFIDPSIDPKGSGWNILQSITAIGSGGFWGKDSCSALIVMPGIFHNRAQILIFSIIAEEFGFVGCIVLFILYGILLFRCIVLIETSKDRFSQYVIGGLLGIFAFHFYDQYRNGNGNNASNWNTSIFCLLWWFISLTGLISIGILTGISARRYSA